jgi:hypothetical protein
VVAADAGEDTRASSPPWYSPTSARPPSSAGTAAQPSWRGGCEGPSLRMWRGSVSSVEEERRWWVLQEDSGGGRSRQLITSVWTPLEGHDRATAVESGEDGRGC